MPATCPTGSTLPCFCIGGQLSTACCDDAGNWPKLKVTTELIGAGRDPVIDPTNCAIVVPSFIEDVLEGTAGCWCTCNLPATFNPDDPELALQPSGLLWKIQVFAEDEGGVFQLVAGPFETGIDGSKDYGALGDCCLLDGPCGECINITCLLEAPATEPPTDRFCNAVMACLAPITGTGLLAGKVSGDYDAGWVIDLTCADIDACLPDLVFSTDGTSIGVTQGGPHGHTVNAVVTSADPSNIATIGPDGGTLVDCGAVLGCLSGLSGTGVLAGNVTGNYTDGWVIDLTCEDIQACIPAESELSLTTDGTTTGVTPDPTDDHKADIVVTDADPSNIATIGPNGGTLVTCDSVLGCVNFEYIPFNPVTHDAGAIEGDGTPTAPFQIPLPQVDVEIENVAITNTTVNADGSTTVTYTITEADDGDANAPTHTFDVTIPAAAELNFEYVSFNPTDHANGVIEGSGTTADPWQIPVCCDTYRYVAYDPAVHTVNGLVGDGTAANPYQIPLPATAPTPDVYQYVDFDSTTHTSGTLAGSGTTAAPYQIPLPPDICDLLDDLADATQTAAATDEILVIQTNGDCARKTIPAGTTDTNTTYTLNDNGTSNIRLLDDQGTVISTIALCDLLDDIMQVGTAPTGGLVLTYDPVNDACSLAPAPTGGGTIDICDELAKVTTAATCSADLELITNECEVVTVGDLQPAHILTDVTVPASACASLSGGGATASITSMVEQDAGAGQLGSLVIGPSFVNVADISPLTVTLPPATNGCVQFVQVSWGGQNNAPNFVPDLGQFVAAGNVTGDATGLVTAVPATIAWGGTARTQVFAVDVTGTGGGTVDITFPDLATGVDPIEGVVNWMVYEVCGITVSDLNTGSSISTTAVGPDGGGNSPGDVSPAPAIDAGSCDAVYFGVGRHVGPNTSGVPTEEPGDDPWSPVTPAGVNVVSEIASLSYSSQCQIGVTAGWIPGDTGAVTFSHVTNTGFVAGDPATWVAIPVSCSTAGGGDCETVEASLDTSNPVCNPPARQRVDVTGNICVSVSPGSRVEVTPTIAGTALDPIVFDNTGNADGIERCIPYQYTEMLAGVIPPGTPAPTLTASFSAEETNGTGNAGDAVVFNQWTLESELIHV